jgi:hypothetical protein
MEIIGSTYFPRQHDRCHTDWHTEDAEIKRTASYDAASPHVRGDS